MNEDRWPGPWSRRLRALVARRPGPLVVVWGWPGSGKRRLLEELVRAGAREVAPAVLGDPQALAVEAMAVRQMGGTCLVCRAWPPDLAFGELRSLASTPLVVATTELRPDLDPEAASLVTPWELLLSTAEIRCLWRELAGEELGEAHAQALRVASDGWLRPLELAAEARAMAGPVPASAAELLALPQVAAFIAGVGAAGADEEELVRRGLGWSSGEGGEGRSPALLEAWRRHAAARPGLRLDVKLFGPPAVLRRRRAGAGSDESAGEAEVVHFKLHRVFKLFAYLAGRPERRATKAELVDAAFADEGVEVLRRNFHPTITYLRRALVGKWVAPDPVPCVAGIYQLSPSLEIELDVDRFRALLARGAELAQAQELAAAAATWQAAWGLYRGPYADGYDDGWILERREELYRAHLAMLRGLGDVLLALGRLPEALDAYRAVLVEDPLQETVQVAVMGIYAAQGRRDLVRRQYDRLVKLLLDELGVEPLPQTTMEYHRLMG